MTTRRADTARPAVGLVIRDANEEDMVRVQRIYAHHVLHGIASFEEDAPALEQMLARRSNVLRQGLPFLVAELEGAVIGYSYAAPYRARSGYRYTIEDSVYMADGLSGQGVGYSLLMSLIERCELGSWRQMIAVIGDSSNEASIRLHSKLGFTHVGTLRSVGFKLGRWVDSVLMQRELGPGDTTLPRLP